MRTRQECMDDHPAGKGRKREKEKSMARTDIRYPDIEVQLVGMDGNAFAIVGRVQRALRMAGVPGEEINEFHREATSGDYQHLLRTCMKWVSVQ